MSFRPRPKLYTESQPGRLSVGTSTVDDLQITEIMELQLLGVITRQRHGPCGKRDGAVIQPRI